MISRQVRKQQEDVPHRVEEDVDHTITIEVGVMVVDVEDPDEVEAGVGISPYLDTLIIITNREEISDIRCFNCDEYGHYASKCKDPKKNGNEANLTQEEEPVLLLTVCGENATNMVLINEEKVFPK